MSEAMRTAPAPAPWQVRAWGVLSDANGHAIAVLPEGYSLEGGTDNLRLAAAAPDLLEALVEVDLENALRFEMRQYERARGTVFGIAAASDSDARAWQARLKKIKAIIKRRRAAIARATGGES